MTDSTVTPSTAPKAPKQRRREPAQVTTDSADTPPVSGAAVVAAATPPSGAADALLGRLPEPVRRVLSLANAFRLVVAYLVLVVVFSFTVHTTTFVSWDNYKIILILAADMIVMATALTIVLAVGQFDLSVGSVVSFTGVASVSMMALHGHGAAWAIIGGIVAGAAVGAVSGTLIAYGKIPAFVATLAMASVVVGLESWISNNSVLINHISPIYLDIGQKQVFGLPLAVYIALLVTLLAWVFLDFSVTGRRIRAIGANPDGARLAGIRTARYVLLSFVVFGILAGLTGIMVASQNGSASSGVGEPLLLPAYTGALLGVSATRTGRVHALGTAFGVLFMGTLSTGLTQLNFPPWSTPVIQGGVLALALFLARGKSTKLF